MPNDWVLSSADRKALKRLRYETEDQSWRMRRLLNGVCILGQKSGDSFVRWKTFRGELDTPIIAWAIANHWKHIRAIQSRLERQEKEREAEEKRIFSDAAGEAAGSAWDSTHRSIVDYGAT